MQSERIFTVQESSAVRRSVCIISFSPVARDARVLRQIRYLSPHFELTVIGFGEAHPDWKSLPGVHFISITPTRFTGLKRILSHALLCCARINDSFYERWYWK